MTQKRLYQAIIFLGLLPTIAIFVWGVYQALQMSAVDIVSPLSVML